MHLSLIHILLLGVGPTADGIIEQPAVERLAEVGRWMQKNGEAIYNMYSCLIDNIKVLLIFLVVFNHIIAFNLSLIHI